MAMMKRQHFNPHPLLMFSFVAFLCPVITAGFHEPLDWETGLDEELYNLQSESTFYNSHLAGLCTSTTRETTNYWEIERAQGIASKAKRSLEKQLKYWNHRRK
jgi:hypothetical protein